ncbi:hypothetical protein [Mesorhizobium sp. CN2-181]|uniref:hypothetical protein n=1 Tax=Mesorhizobium yinganensis TaxID=3157707 RepID=UPI0032B83D48
MSDHRTFAAGVAISVSYWKRDDDGRSSVASDREEANWASIEGSGQYPRLEFRKNSQWATSGWYQLDQAVILLNQAFEAGKFAKLKEMRQFLGIQDR